MNVRIINSTVSVVKNNYFTTLYNAARVIGFEAAIWIGALIFLAFINNPAHTHFTICTIKNLGFDFCPGCGLGNSISYILHGDFYHSFLSHPLGLFALIILIIRIFNLIKHNWSLYGKYITTNALS